MGLITKLRKRVKNEKVIKQVTIKWKIIFSRLTAILPHDILIIDSIGTGQY